MKLFKAYSVLFCIGMIFLSTQASADVLAKKTFDRWVDVAILEGKMTNDLVGKPLNNLRMYACTKGVFEPIRFQIDEMTGENGDWILPSGPRPNSDLSNGKLDTWDKILFMADDSGDKISTDMWPSGYTKGEEIEVIDPLTGQKGWCYLLYFASNPPAKCAKPDYVRFKYSLTDSRFESDYHCAEYIETKDGKVATYYDHLSLTEFAGGSGKNFVDRLKIRVSIKAVGGALTLKMNEEQLRSDIMTYKVGPIRWTRRAEQYRKIPGGLKVLRVVSDTYEHRDTATTPAVFNVPFKLDTVLTSFIARFGVDYTPEVLGSMAYSSNNKKGFLIDGKMSDDEKNFFNPELDEWRMITGKFGTLLTRTILTPEIKDHIKITMGIIDDVNQKYPPERIPGTIGYVYQDWDATHLPKGTYYLFVEHYFVPHYKPGDEVKYVNYIDNPIRFRVDGKEQTNLPLLLPNVGKRYL
jgi:hypothetical protein